MRIHEISGRLEAPELTISDAEQYAADIAGVDIEALRHAEQPHVHELGSIAISGNVQAFMVRAHDGRVKDPTTGELAAYQGGTRLIEGDFSDLTVVRDMTTHEAARLAYGMLDKRAAVGSARNGGKAVIATSVHPKTLKYGQKMEIIEHFAEATYIEGIVGNTGDHRTIVAPDMFTGDSVPGQPGLMNVYIEKYHALNSSDPYWQGVASGKVEHGNEFRKDATSWGVFLAAEHARGLSDALPGPQSVKIQGLGNVGLPLAMFMAEDKKKQFAVTVVSDMGPDRKIRTLHITGETGDSIRITREIAEQLKNETDKVSALAAIIRQTQPELEFAISEDRNAVLELDADWFIPAAGPDIKMSANVARLGVIEAANDAISEEDSEELHEAGKIVVTAAFANPAGTLGSDVEIADNRRTADNPAADPTNYEDSRREVGERAKRGLDRLGRVSSKMDGIPSHHIAPVISIGQRAIWHGIEVNNVRLAEALHEQAV